MFHKSRVRRLTVITHLLICMSLLLNSAMPIVEYGQVDNVEASENNSSPYRNQIVKKVDSVALQVGPLTIQNNNFEANNVFGLDSNTAMNAERNWWGDANGPTHQSSPGGEGDAVTDHVDFDPWLNTAVNINLPYPSTTGTGTIKLTQNSFVENGFLGIESDISLNAEANWWNHPSGPFHANSNPDGLGDAVSDNVDYDPWLVTPPGLRNVEQIYLDQLVNDSVGSLGYKDYFFEAAVGQSLVVEVTSLTGSESLWVFGRFSNLPLWTDYDLKSSEKTSRGTYELLISPAQDGTYYFSIFGRDISSAEGNFQITVRSVDHYLSDASPNALGNTGNGTLNISGLGFVEGMEIQLKNNANPTIAAKNVTVVSSTSIWAEFELAGVDTAVYTLHTKWPNGKTASLPNAITITTGIGPRLEAYLVAPEAVRPGRQYVLWLEYANTGDANMPAPLFIVSSPQNAAMRLGKHDPYAPGALQILGINFNQPAGTLSPGATHRIPIYFKAPNTNRLQFDLEQMEANNTSIDWDALETAVRPATINADLWATTWHNFKTTVGSTWADYQNSLNAQATHLAQYGNPVYQVNAILSVVMGRAAGSYLQQTLAMSLDAYAPAKGLPLTFSRAASDTLYQRFNVGPFGRSWSHNFEYQLIQPDKDTVIIHAPGGVERRFAKGTDNTWQAAVGDYGKLEFVAGTFQLREQNGLLWQFNAAGRLSSIEELNGNQISLTYTGGNLTTLQHTNGQGFSLEYNTHGRISRLLDHAGRTIDFVYDASGEYLLSVTLPGGVTTTYSYVPTTGSASDHAIQTVTYPNGTHQYYAYDANGRLAAQWLDGDAERIEYSYSSTGTITATDAANAKTMIHLGVNNQIMAVQNPLGQQAAFQSNAQGNLTQSTNPGGGTSTMAYDGAGNPVQLSNPLGHTLNMGYIKQWNRLDWLQDAKGNQLDFAYDGAGNLIAITHPDATSETFGYDSAGNLIRVTNRRGESITFAYNTLGQITQKDYADGRSITYTHDTVGRVTAVTDATGTINLTYDDRGYMTGIAYPSGHSFTFAYNDAGLRTQSVSEDGYTLNYHYDAVGRLEQMTDGANTKIIRYTYDTVGQLTREDKGNGTSTTYAYDDAGNLLSMVNYGTSNQVLSQFDYTYNANGSRDSMTTLSGTTTYNYDAIGQLIGVTYPDGQQETYAYDAAGNRTVTTSGSGETTYTTNNLNQYTQVGAATYSYDADGNMTAKTDNTGTTTYAYDVENRLIRVTNPTDEYWEYTYDALGNRTAVNHNGIITNYVHDPLGLVNIAAEYDSSDTLVARYTHGFGLVARTNAANNAAYYAFDGTGHTRQLTDATGTVANTYDYTPFGTPLQADEAIPNPFRYSGKFGVINDENGLSFMRARFYDKELGRFITVDPIGLHGSDSNLYSFGYNNPINFVDPEGTTVPLILVGAVAGGLVNTFIYLGTTESPSKGGAYGAVFEGVVTGAAAGASGGATLLLGTGFLGGAGRYTIEKFLDGKMDEFDGDEMFIEGFKTGVLNVLGGVFDDILPTVIKWNAGGPGFWRTLGGLNKHGKHLWTHIIVETMAAGFIDHMIDLLTVIDKWLSQVIRPRDPNEKVGPAGFGTEQIVEHDELLQYTVYFENVPTASAAAQEVFVTDVLDPDLDWQTFQITEVAFGDTVIAVEEVSDQYHTQVAITDFRTNEDKSWWVDITAQLDYQSGEVSWALRMLDPETGELPADPFAGLLPPNDDTHRGEGHVSFTIKPDADVTSGTVITNSASIVFDTNAPIQTNEVWNTIGTPGYELFLPLVIKE